MHPRGGDGAQRSGRREFLELSVPRLETLVKCRAILHPGISAGLDHHARVFRARRHRLFAQNVLASAGSRLGQWPVQVVRRRDIDSVEARRLQKVSQAAVFACAGSQGRNRRHCTLVGVAESK